VNQRRITFQPALTSLLVHRPFAIECIIFTCPITLVCWQKGTHYSRVVFLARKEPIVYSRSSKWYLL